MNPNVKLIGITSNNPYPKVEVERKLCGKHIVMWRSHYYRGDNPCDCCHLAKRYPRLYSIYNNMKTRCYNKNSPNYKNYGHRGITMCDEWLKSFASFKDWAISNGYSDDLTIERIDVNGNYDPLNCKWIPSSSQANNKTTTIRIGDVCLRQWCIDNGLNYKLVHQYIKRHPNMSIEYVLNWYLRKYKELASGK